MSFRTTSRTRQWTLWLCAGLVAVAAHVVLSRLVYGSVSWAIYEPHRQRLVLPLVLLFWLFAWETRWDGVRREKEESKGDGKEPGEGQVKTEGQGRQENSATDAGEPLASCQETASPPTGRTSGEAVCRSLQRKKESDAERHFHSSPSTPDINPSLSGEDLYALAREHKHGTIPDFRYDADYLDLLGASAGKDHAPAMAKLGEYAMRRAAWVEAYYWMKQAQRNGMHGLSPTLREVRKNWALAGFPDQSTNVNRLFTREAGSIGRALLHIDSGREASKAREFLKEHYPDFLGAPVPAS